MIVCLSTLIDEFIQRDYEGFADAYPNLLGSTVENDDGEEAYVEIYEYWAVTPWLAKKLINRSEKVDQDFYGLCVWGRTCTGQAIYMDGVIRRIVEELG